MATELSKEEKTQIVNSHIKSLLHSKYSLRIDILKERARIVVNSDGVENLNKQIVDVENQIVALEAELDSLTEQYCSMLSPNKEKKLEAIAVHIRNLKAERYKAEILLVAERAQGGEYPEMIRRLEKEIKGFSAQISRLEAQYTSIEKE